MHAKLEAVGQPLQQTHLSRLAFRMLRAVPSRLRVQSLGFKIEGLGFKVQGVKTGIQDA